MIRNNAKLFEKECFLGGVHALNATFELGDHWEEVGIRGKIAEVRKGVLQGMDVLMVGGWIHDFFVNDSKLVIDIVFFVFFGLNELVNIH